MSDSQKKDIDKQIRPVLRELNSTSNAMEASAVISRDGLSIASVMGTGVDPDRLGAMCAALLGLADTTAKELQRGELINLGMVLLEAKKTAQKLATII